MHLKLYVYGYLNRVHSSRRLERQGGRKLQVMWLLRQESRGARGRRALGGEGEGEAGSRIDKAAARFVAEWLLIRKDS